MILYHGSCRQLEVLKPQQAEAGEGISVPDGELLNAIYLTPYRESAIAMAARVEGVTNINDESKTIEFEHPELFDPEKEVYLYLINSESIPKENIKQIDSWQYAVVDLPELKPESVEAIKAGEVEKYYELKQWHKEGEIGINGEQSGRETRK